MKYQINVYKDDFKIFEGLHNAVIMYTEIVKVAKTFLVVAFEEGNNPYERCKNNWKEYPSTIDSFEFLSLINK
ncbi:MAG: hypothetical protein LBR17_01295 [Bacteroidales bacterium]|jgi:hypothetical protein|nr:hypothetical protein [Bacteroidales bacterium]